MRMRYSIGLVAIALVLISAVITVVAQQQPGVPAGGGRGQGTAPVAGQQPAAARGATAPPPINWPSPPLPAGPIVLDTGIQHQIRLFVTKGLNQPWSMAFLPDGAILISERPGRLRIVRNGILDPTPVAGLPQVQAQGLAGLMDLALHPRFDENKFVYFTYHKPATPRCRRRSPDRTRRWWQPRSHHARPRTLGWSIAYRSARPLFCHSQRQCFTNRFRKRWHDLHDRRCRRSSGCDAGTRSQQSGWEGASAPRRWERPTDNPFVGRTGYRPEIFTMGHRNALGLVLNPVTGEIWECENGPNGGDEINVLQAGKNYGWPVVSFGRFYLGPRVSEKPWQEGMEQPLVFWVPCDCYFGNDVLHRRQISQLEEPRLCRRHAHRRGSAIRPSRANRLQRQMGRAPSRRNAARTSKPHSRCPARSGRIPIPVDR